MSEGKKPLGDRLDLLAGLMVENLIDLIQRGEASPGDRAVIRNLLRDAGYELMPRKTADLVSVVAKLPFEDEDEECSEEVA